MLECQKLQIIRHIFLTKTRMFPQKCLRRSVLRCEVQEIVDYLPETEKMKNKTARNE